MSAQSKTSNPNTSADTSSFTLSPALASGAMPCDALGGRTIGEFGQCPARANLSARQAKAAGLLMSGTFGPPRTTLLESARLASCLVNRLRAKTDLAGSTLYKLTWKDRATPAGRLISALRASARPISDSASGGLEKGWNTPRATDGSNGGPSQAGGALPADAALSGWPTPMAGTPAQNGNNAAGNSDYSRKVADLSGWPTPTTRDHKDGSECLNVPVNALLGRAVWAAGWPTPNCPSGGRSMSIEKMDITGRTPDGRKHTASLEHAVKFATPARLTASGEMLTGCSAGMESGGQLNPEFSLWLMGIPNAWASCGVRAMQSLRPPRKPSSKPTKKVAPTDVFG